MYKAQKKKNNKKRKQIYTHKKMQQIQTIELKMKQKNIA